MIIIYLEKVDLSMASKEDFEFLFCFKYEEEKSQRCFSVCLATVSKMA